MNRLLISIILTQLVSFVNAQQKRDTYKQLPVVYSNSDTLIISIGDYRNWWIVSPHLEKDSLNFSSLLPLEAKFISDRDSISFLTGPGQSHHFYVKAGNKDHAHTVIYNRTTLSNLQYSNKNRRADSLSFLFDKNYAAVPYFLQLRKQYPIDSCIANTTDDASRVLNLLHWVHQQWKHDGGRSPRKNDAISILEEVKEGKGFPCFAYAEVLRAALNSVGIPTRRLALKTRDVETQQYASGHVVNEVWLRDQKKWVFVDPQEDIMPYLNGQPLNAVEFQQAITHHMNEVELKSLSNISKADYLDFVYPYLFYFDSAFDQRYGSTTKKLVNGKSSLMLVPLGSNNPAKAGFYSNQKIDYCIYTNALKNFYKKPLLK